MAILAASIITRSGKAVLSRQFCDLTKNRVTELLAQFPSLVAENSTQHTTVEDEHVRYVYQPLDDLYLVLITNRQSNILQDIETLATFVETVSQMVRSVTEDEVFDHAFEILGAFDEIVTLGYKENLSMLQIRTFLEMDSHEEKIQEIIDRNKEFEANEERKRRAKEIQRKEMMKRQNEFSSISQSQQFNNNYAQTETYRPSQEYQQQSYAPTPVDPTPKARVAPKGRGLQLGKSKTRGTSVSGDAAAEPLIEHVAPIVQAPVATYQDTEPIVDERPTNNGILITIEEKITAEITREGSIQASELKGILQLRINNPELAHSKILLANNNTDNSIQFKTHPNVDKALFSSDSTIGLKNPEKPFPSNDQNIGVLRWRGTGKADDNTFVPIIFSAWLSSNGDAYDVTLEFEMSDSYQEQLSEIIVLVPVATEAVELKSDGAEISDITEEGVHFKIDSLSPGESSTLEFSIEASSEEALFPIEVSFKNESPVNTLGKINVVDVVSASEGESLPFDLASGLSAEGYFIV